MAVDFSRRVNTDLSTTPFQYIVFGKDGGLLEVELNEAQMLAYERQKNTLKLLGNLYSKPSMFKYDSEKGVFSIEPGILSVNGYLINITDTVSIPNVTDGSYIYIAVTTETVDKDSTIKKFGISSEENIENTIKDDRIGIETSRRESISVTIGTTSEDNSVLLGDISGTEFIISSEFKNIPKGFTEFDNALDKINSNLSSHTSNTSNPHSVTKAQVGLDNVENKSSATIRGEITKSNVTTALGYTPLNQSLKGSASGLAELDSNGKVPSSQLPSFVDDVVEGYLSGGKFYKESAHTTEISGESGKIYIDLSTKKTYRWSGSAFVVISETLALGETSSTAYRGDRGKTAYDHSQSTHARTDATKVEKSSTNGNIKINGTETTVYTHPSGTNPHGTTKSDVGLGNVDNTSDKDKPISTAQQAEFNKLNSNLDTLEYSDVAGGSNIWSEKYVVGGINTSGVISTYTSAIRSDYFEVKPSTKYTVIKNTPNFFYAFYDENKTVIGSRVQISGGNGSVTTPSNAKYMIIMVNGVTTYDNSIAIIEGEATSYKPYIPSVKMLADEVKQQNESLGDYGLTNKVDSLKQGFYDEKTGEWKDHARYVCSVGSIPCAVGDYITIKADASKVSYVVVIYFNGTTFVSSKPISSNSNIFIVPSGVNNFKYHVLGIDYITPQTVGHVGVYINNAIDEINSNLVEQKMLGWTVPSECPIQNYVDSDGVFHQRVGRVDLSKLTWTEYGTNRYKVANPTDMKIVSSTSDVFKGYCDKYNVTSATEIFNTTNPTIGLHTNGNLYCNSTSIPSGYLYYELETPITMTIDGNEAVTKVNESLSALGKCKNLLSANITTDSSKGITCTKNSDGTYTIQGTNNTSSNAQFMVGVIINGTGQGKLVGVPKGSSGITLQTNYNGSWGTSTYWDTGNGAILPDISKVQRMAILVAPSTTVNHIIKPMITSDLGATYNDYEPYTGNGKDLMYDVAELNESLAYNASKNMLLVNVGFTSGDVNITSKDKSTALLNGTNTGNILVFATADVIPRGAYHLKLSNRVGALYVWDSTHSKTIIEVDNTEYTFVLTEPGKLLIGFSVGSGHSFTNFEVSGQLEEGTIATGFVPYNGKSNLELTNDIVKLKNDLSVKKQIINSTLIVKRIGNVVTINGYCTLDSENKVGILNEDFRPTENIRAVCNVGDNAYSPGTPSYIVIGISGEIEVVTSATTKVMYCSVSYIIG